MYRYACLLIFVLISARGAFAQHEKLKGTWVSDQQDLIEILHLGRSDWNYISNTHLEEMNLYLFIYGDTLSYQSIYTSSATDFKIEYTDRYDLKIIQASDFMMVVKPVSDLSKKFFQNRPVLTFKNKKYLIDKSLVFEKLVYHASQAWDGPTVALEVDSNKVLYMKYQNNSYGPNRGLATGNYSATLDDTTYSQLIAYLQNCNLRKLRFGNIRGNDSPEIRLIVYYNGKRKFLKSMFPPRLAEELLSFIVLRLQNYLSLKPTEEERKLEW